MMAQRDIAPTQSQKDRMGAIGSCRTDWEYVAGYSEAG